MSESISSNPAFLKAVNEINTAFKYFNTRDTPYILQVLFLEQNYRLTPFLKISLFDFRYTMQSFHVNKENAKMLATSPHSNDLYAVCFSPYRGLCTPDLLANYKLPLPLRARLANKASKILEYSSHTDENVRFALTQNTHLTEEVYIKMCDDDSPLVKFMLFHSTILPKFNPAFVEKVLVPDLENGGQIFTCIYNHCLSNDSQPFPEALIMHFIHNEYSGELEQLRKRVLRQYKRV